MFETCGLVCVSRQNTTSYSLDMRLVCWLVLHFPQRDPLYLFPKRLELPRAELFLLMYFEGTRQTASTPSICVKYAVKSFMTKLFDRSSELKWMSSLAFSFHPDNCCRSICLEPKIATLDLLSAILKHFVIFCDIKIWHPAHCKCLSPWICQTMGKIQEKSSIILFKLTFELKYQFACTNSLLFLTNSNISCFSSKCFSSLRDNRCGRCGWLDVECVGPDPETISFCELILKNVGVPSIVFTMGFNKPPRSNSCADIFLLGEHNRNEVEHILFFNRKMRMIFDIITLTLFVVEWTWTWTWNYRTGVVAPEPPLDELFGAFPCNGDGSSLLPEFACDINHESTNCLVAFLFQ